MSKQTIFIELEEWDTVACLVSRLLPNEAGRFPGAALRHVRGRRVWTVCTPSVQVEVPGGHSDIGVTGSVWLSSRLVVHAAELALTEDGCALAIGERSATVANVMGDATFGLAQLSDPPPMPTRAASATPARAVVSAVQLHSLLGSARRFPAGVDLGSTTSPDLLVGIEPGFVSASVAWARFGASPVHARVPAHTANAAVARVPMLDLALLLDAIDSELNVNIEIDVDNSTLWVGTPAWTAAVTLPAPPVVPLAGAEPATLAQAMERVGAKRRSDGRWRVKVDGVRVRVESLDHAAMVRATVRLAKGIAPEPAVLAEINDLNRGLVAARVWLHNGTLSASVDVATRNLVDLEDRIRSLVADTVDLGPMIAMLGATIS